MLQTIKIHTLVLQAVAPALWITFVMCRFQPLFDFTEALHEHAGIVYLTLHHEGSVHIVINCSLSTNKCIAGIWPCSWTKHKQREVTYALNMEADAPWQPATPHADRRPHHNQMATKMPDIFGWPLTLICNMARWIKWPYNILPFALLSTYILIPSVTCILPN
jgi:hypothetical protein